MVPSDTESPAMQETRVPSLGQEGLLEKEMAAHSSILAWEVPWTEEPGGLQPMGTQSRTQQHTDTHGKPAVNIILSGERLKAFPLRSGAGHGAHSHDSYST